MSHQASTTAAAWPAVRPPRPWPLGQWGWRRLLTDDTRAGEAAQGAAPRFPAGGTTERAADRSWMPPMTPTPAG